MTRDLVLFGDCRERLKEFDDLARMCITSPPYYGLRNYGDKIIKLVLNKHQKIM